MSIIVTGGAGFIGSNFVLHWLREEQDFLLNLDKLTYASQLDNLTSVAAHPNYQFVQGDIADRSLIRYLLHSHRPRAIVHFAAETHVDRSISSPEAFIQTNVVGTSQLLEESRLYWQNLSSQEQQDFRFLHISTDEVYGSLQEEEEAFDEGCPYRPNSPYSASKAASDHMVRAYYQTYGLPTMVVHSSNNFGPYQHPEKLIPHMIQCALRGEELPIYGDGSHIRDWLFVHDHCEGLRLTLERGQPGETYLFGGHNEYSNLSLVKMLCRLLDEALPDSTQIPHEQQLSFVADRPGHDWRYAVNTRKVREELGWSPRSSFEENLRQTLHWYLNNRDWVLQRSAAFPRIPLSLPGGGEVGG